MGTLQIRHLPDDVREALALRAELEHRSLAQQAIVELRRMPELLAGDQRRRTLAAIKRDLSTTQATLVTQPEDLIRDDRGR